MLSRSKAKRKAHMEKTRTLLTEKIRESLVSVLPIIIIVTLLCLFLVPMQPTLLLTFLIGALMIVVGMGLFSLGAERSMTIIGNKIGTALTKTNKLPTSPFSWRRWASAWVFLWRCAWCVSSTASTCGGCCWGAT